MFSVARSFQKKKNYKNIKEEIDQNQLHDRYEICFLFSTEIHVVSTTF